MTTLPPPVVHRADVQHAGDSVDCHRPGMAAMRAFMSREIGSERVERDDVADLRADSPTARIKPIVPTIPARAMAAMPSRTPVDAAEFAVMLDCR